MKKEQNQGTNDLSELRNGFLEFRTGPNSSKRYPQSLKKLAVAALGSGVSIRKVAEATGVSSQSIGLWRGPVGAQSPSELKIIRGHHGRRISPKIPLDQESATAKISFESGVVMEIPVSLLNSLVITALNGGES